MLALAAAGSFVDAAQASNLSQPSLHRAVRDVERLSGVPLVERRGRGVRLTAGGPAARARLRPGDRGDPARRSTSSPPAETGRDPHRRDAARPRPAAAAGDRALPRRSGLRRGSRSRKGPHAELIERLRDGRLDFLIGALREPAPGPDVVQEPLFDDRLVIVAGRGHPLAGAAAPSLDAARRFPMGGRAAGRAAARVWRALFEDAGVPCPTRP